MQQCHKIYGTWSSFWTTALVSQVTQVALCDTRANCLVKARVSIQQRWHGGLLLVRVFGKLCCQVVTLLPLLLPPLLLLHLHLPRLTFHCAYCSSCKNRNLKKEKSFFYNQMQLQTEVGKRKPLWGKSEEVKVGKKKIVKKSENWMRKDFLQVLCRKGNRPGGQDYEIVIIRLADL